ncbi:MAG: BTAD domain-containing putative transcriptional regulator [candidate division WOR-3 bacterium]
MQNLVLQTKLQPPQLKGKILRRERLINLLKDNLDKKIILICADAGYGKTTLLSQLITEENLPCIFYRMDKNDSDIAVFMSHLIFGLKQIQKDLGVRCEDVLSQNGKLADKYEFMFGTLINELAEKKVQELFIILDDYHNIFEDSKIHKALDYFIENSPDNVHTIIASRSLPPLPSLSRWKAKQNLFEVSRQELKFTEDEMRRLIKKTYNFTLTTDELKILAERTEGWITGIQLILQCADKNNKGAIKEKLFNVMQQEESLFDYFTNELMSREPLTIQDFLKKIAILEVITPEICDVVMETQNSEKILKEIQKRNIFLSAIGLNQYRYHPLFQHFLLNKLETEHKKSLYIKTGDYFQQKNLYEHAIDYYLRGENYERAGELISTYGEKLIEQAKFFMLSKWLSYIPSYIHNRYPLLYWLQSILYHNDGKFDEALNVLQQAEELLREQKDNLGLSQVLYEQGVVQWRCNRYKKALVALKKALKTCPDYEIRLKERIYNLIGLTVWDFLGVNQAKNYLLKAKNLIRSLPDLHEHLTVEANLAMTDYELGNAAKAFNAFRTLIEKIGQHYSYGRGVLFLNSIRIALDYGEINWAEKTLCDGYSLCKDYSDPHSLAALNLASGLICIEKQQWDKAEIYLNEALQKYLKLGLNRYIGFTYLSFATLKCYQNDLKKAAHYIAQAHNFTSESDGILFVLLLLEESWQAICAGAYKKAERIAIRCYKLARKINSKSALFEVCLIRSVIMNATGKTKKGLQLLNQNILMMALKYGYKGILMRALRRSPYLLELAQLLLEHGNLKSSVADFLSEIITKPSRTSSIGEGIKLFIFGKPRIFKGGYELSIKDLVVEKAAKLFVFFALNPNKRFSREELIEIFWPEQNPVKGGKNLRTALYYLRKAVGEVVIYRNKGYQLNENFTLWVDIFEFNSIFEKIPKTRTNKEKESLLNKLRNFYGGAICEGWYDSWLDDMRRYYEERYLNILILLAEIYVKTNRIDKYVETYEEIIKVDPFNEEHYRNLMVGYSRLGRIQNIKMNYEKLKKLLADELNKEPEIETQNLFKKLTSSK